MNIDPLETPAYDFADVARYLQVDATTLGRWALGYRYKNLDGSISTSEPLLVLAGRNPNSLSFINLIELHVLRAFRIEHGIAMSKIRKALDWLKKRHPGTHPLAEYWFKTDGKEIFIDVSCELEVITQGGQLAMKKLLDKVLSRIEWDGERYPIRLYPYTRDLYKPDPGLIVIDPRVKFGRPVIKGSGVPVSIIAERFRAGEGVDILAKDYGQKKEAIEEAIRYEQKWRAA